MSRPTAVKSPTACNNVEGVWCALGPQYLGEMTTECRAGASVGRDEQTATDVQGAPRSLAADPTRWQWT